MTSLTNGREPGFSARVSQRRVRGAHAELLLDEMLRYGHSFLKKTSISSQVLMRSRFFGID